MVGVNSFTGANLSGIANKGVLAMCTELMKFRKQLTRRTELMEQSGWNDELNEYLESEVGQLEETLIEVTYQAGTTPNTTVLPAPIPITLSYSLDGAHADYPQLNDERYQNDWLKMFCWELDRVFVEATRLDCRHSGNTVPKQQAEMIKAMLNNLMSIIQKKGGETNRSSTPTGTLASQEPQTFSGTV